MNDQITKHELLTESLRNTAMAIKAISAADNDFSIEDTIHCGLIESFLKKAEGLGCCDYPQTAMADCRIYRLAVRSAGELRDHICKVTGKLHKTEKASRAALSFVKAVGDLPTMSALS